MRRQCRAQMDLFLSLTRPGDMSGAERQSAVALLQTLLQTLLMEAGSCDEASQRASGQRQEGSGQIRLRPRTWLVRPSCMSANRRRIRSSTILRASGGSMVWSSAHGSSAGTTSNSSTMISADPVAELSARASRSCWPQFAKNGLAPWYRSRHHALPGTAEIGTLCWSSAAWSAH